MNNHNIKNFPDVEINGISKKIYNLSLSGGGEQVTRLTIHVLGKEEKELSFNNPILIKIEGFYSFSGFLVSKSYTESSDGFYTELTFLDTSIILDKIYVGLKGKHGVIPPSYPISNAAPTTVIPQQLVNRPLSKTAPSTTSVSIFATAGYLAPDNIILVGDAVNPCPSQNNLKLNAFDPCNPCKYIKQEFSNETFNCEELKILKIWEVDYTFAQLETSARQKGISFEGFSNNIPDYRTNFTGTLREVLSHWCSLFGYTFYWKGNNTIKFVSLARGIKIDTSKIDENCRVESKTVTDSISDITKTVNMAYFGKPGEIETYNCIQPAPTSVQGRTVLLNAISISDVIQNNNIIQNVYKDDDNFKAAVTLGRYSEKLRNFYCWNNILNFKKASDVKIGNYPIMGWEIIAVCYPEMVENQVKKGRNPDLYKNIYGSLTSSNKSRGNFFSPSEAAKRKNNGVYFVVVKPLNSSANQAFVMEQEVARNFCGKYWSKVEGDEDIDQNDFIAPPGTQLEKITEKVSLKEMLGDENLNFDRPIYQESRTLVILNGLFQRGKMLLLSRGALWSPAQDEETVKNFLEKFDAIAMDRIEPMVSLQGTEQLWAVYPAEKVGWGKRNTRESLDQQTAPPGLTSRRVDQIEVEFKVPSEGNKNRVTFRMPPEGSYLIEKTPTNKDNSVRILIPKCEVLVGEQNNNFGNNFAKIQVNRKDISNDNYDNLSSLNQSSCYTDTNKIITYGQAIIDDISNDLPQKKETIEYTIFGIPSQPISFEDGLQSFSINVSSNGSKTSLIFSNIFPQGLGEEAKINNLKYLIEGKRVGSYKK